MNRIPVVAFRSSYSGPELRICFAPIRAISAASSAGSSAFTPDGIASQISLTNSSGRRSENVKTFFGRKLKKGKNCAAHQKKNIEETTRIPAILGERLCAVIMDDPDGEFLDAAAAVAEQRHPEVLEFRRLLIKQLRILDVPQNEDALLTVGRLESII